MKILNKVVIGAAALVLLTACGPSKVSYDKFHEQALEAAKKENGYTKAVVKGKAKMKDEGKTVEYTFDSLEFTGYTNGRMSALEIAAAEAAAVLKGEVYAIAVGLTFNTAEIAPKSDKLTYYTGGFQIVQEEDGVKQTVKYDANGLPTSIKLAGDGSGSVTISWSK